jgi:hypothetical protein
VGYRVRGSLLRQRRSETPPGIYARLHADEWLGPNFLDFIPLHLMRRELFVVVVEDQPYWMCGWVDFVGASGA